MRVLVGALVLGVLIALYSIAWKLNKNVDIPEGSKGRGCDGCSAESCSLNPLHHGGH